MNISEFFTLTEVLATSRTALAPAQVKAFGVSEAINACKWAHLIGDPLRRKVGPITVNSWYRSPELNKAVGGEPSSEHITGGAVDIVTKDLRKSYELLEGLPYGQRIIYFDSKKNPLWLHVSVQLKPRPQIEKSLTCIVGASKKYAKFTTFQEVKYA
jgi:hypothetical protein